MLKDIKAKFNVQRVLKIHGEKIAPQECVLLVVYFTGSASSIGINKIRAAH